MSQLGRRAFLKFAGMLSPFAVLRNLASPVAGATPFAPPGLDAFLGVSVRLTGRTGLDRGLAETYLGALLANPLNRALLADLSAAAPGTRTPAHVALEEEILTAWYTGTFEIEGRRHRATHAGALMWSALGRRAPGLCAGAGPSWSQPPPATAR
jgi:hypothetical protein